MLDTYENAGAVGWSTRVHVPAWIKIIEATNEVLIQSENQLGCLERVKNWIVFDQIFDCHVFDFLKSRFHSHHKRIPVQPFIN